MIKVSDVFRFVFVKEIEMVGSIKLTPGKTSIREIVKIEKAPINWKFTWKNEIGNLYHYFGNQETIIDHLKTTNQMDEFKSVFVN